MIISVNNAQLPLSVDAFKSAIEGGKASVIRPAPFRANTMRFEAKPGKYIILPITQQPNPDLKFLLRVFSEMPTTLTLVEK